MLQELASTTELEPVVVGRKVADEEKDPEVQCSSDQLRLDRFTLALRSRMWMKLMPRTKRYGALQNSESVKGSTCLSRRIPSLFGMNDTYLRFS